MPKKTPLEFKVYYKVDYLKMMEQLEAARVKLDELSEMMKHVSERGKTLKQSLPTPAEEPPKISNQGYVYHFVLLHPDLNGGEYYRNMPGCLTQQQITSALQVLARDGFIKNHGKTGRGAKWRVTRRKFKETK